MSVVISVFVGFGFKILGGFGWSSRAVVSKVRCMQYNSLRCGKDFRTTDDKHTYIGNMCLKHVTDGMNSQNSLETTALEESCSVKGPHPALLSVAVQCCEGIFSFWGRFTVVHQF